MKTDGLCCPGCGKKLLVDNVLTARVVRLGEKESHARCNRCKRWITVPVVLVPVRDNSNRHA